MNIICIEFRDYDEVDLSDVQDAVEGLADVRGWVGEDAIEFSTDLSRAELVAELRAVDFDVED